MRIWLLHIGEQLPVDGQNRMFRYGYLAKALGDQGHDVLRWAPTFSHFQKSQRFELDCRIRIDDQYAIQFVHAPGYRRNIGLDRLRTYKVLGKRFRDLASRETPPDLILAAIPSLEWADAAVEYGKAHGIPVVIDVRDLWPDVFLNAVPRIARGPAQLVLTPYRRAARRACRQATALTAVSQSYLDWALSHAGRQPGPRDVVMPLGFEPDQLPGGAVSNCVTQLRDLGIDLNQPICLFAGSFERSYDLETVIDAARHLATADTGKIQFILCGDGSKMPRIRRRAAGLQNVHLLGWVDAAMLQGAASIATFGLCAYAVDATQSLPNKPFEYMAGGLAIVSSLRGELEELLNRHQCGVTYQAGSAKSLASCLDELVRSPVRLEAMRVNGHKTWLKHYRSSVTYARFARYLTALSAPMRQAA